MALRCALLCVCDFFTLARIARRVFLFRRRIPNLPCIRQTHTHAHTSVRVRLACDMYHFAPLITALKIYKYALTHTYARRAVYTVVHLVPLMLGGSHIPTACEPFKLMTYVNTHERSIPGRSVVRSIGPAAVGFIAPPSLSERCELCTRVYVMLCSRAGGSYTLCVCACEWVGVYLHCCRRHRA